MKYKCCICGENYKGYGNNPNPIKEEGRCCENCNWIVVKERIKQAYR